jgi:hypothetical protein
MVAPRQAGCTVTLRLHLMVGISPRASASLLLSSFSRIEVICLFVSIIHFLLPSGSNPPQQECSLSRLPCKLCSSWCRQGPPCLCFLILVQVTCIRSFIEVAVLDRPYTRTPKICICITSECHPTALTSSGCATRPRVIGESDGSFVRIIHLDVRDIMPHIQDMLNCTDGRWDICW